MKRRKLFDLGAALASLWAVSLGGDLHAETPETPAQLPLSRFMDSQVEPASALTATTAAESATIASHGASYSYGDAGCDTCGTCDECGGGYWFAEFEGLAWWRKSRPLPPLVTTSLTGTLEPDAGVIGEPATRILFGGDNYSDDIQAGGRVTIGRYFGQQRQFGIAGRYFQLGQEDLGYFRAAADGNDILALPYIDATTGLEDAILLNFPGVSSSGSVNVSQQNDVLGADVYGRYLLYNDGCLSIDAIGGYQFTRVDDSLQITAFFNDDTVFSDDDVTTIDTFDARNEFHGGSVGFLARAQRGRFSVKALGKIGLGNMHQVVTINGSTVAQNGGPPAVSNFGAFALPTNIGTYTDDKFAYVPEGNINFGYALTESWTVGVGYSFIYWSDIVTAGNTVDRTLNLTQIPVGPLVGDARPGFAFGERSDYWVQGLNFSLEFAY